MMLRDILTGQQSRESPCPTLKMSQPSRLNSQATCHVSFSPGQKWRYHRPVLHLPTPFLYFKLARVFYLPSIPNFHMYRLYIFSLYALHTSFNYKCNKIDQPWRSATHGAGWALGIRKKKDRFPCPQGTQGLVREPAVLRSN